MSYYIHSLITPYCLFVGANTNDRRLGGLCSSVPTAKLTWADEELLGKHRLPPPASSLPSSPPEFCLWLLFALWFCFLLFVLFVFFLLFGFWALLAFGSFAFAFPLLRRAPEAQPRNLLSRLGGCKDKMMEMVWRAMQASSYSEFAAPFLLCGAPGLLLMSSSTLWIVCTIPSAVHPESLCCSWSVCDGMNR